MPNTAADTIRLLAKIAALEQLVGEYERSVYEQAEKLQEKEEALRLERDRSREYLAIAGVMILVLDVDHTVRLINRKGCEILGYEERDIIGRRWADQFLPEPDREMVNSHFDRLKAGQPPEEIETAVLAKDGRERIVNWHHTVLRDAGGAITGILSSGADITERKRAVEALKESEHRLALVLDATNEGLWDWNIRTGEVYYSRRWKESLGYAPGEVSPHVSFWESVVHPEDMPRVQEGLQAHLAGRAPNYQCENRLRMKSGEWRWNLDRGMVVERDADGRPLRMVGTDTDITERKRAERRLAAQYEVSQVLSESATLEEASTRVLQVLCDYLGWEAGSIWRVDRDANLLQCLDIWHVPSLDAAAFVADSRQRTFPPGVGMPGRVWSAAEPAWIPDVQQDANFPRALAAARAGFHGALGFPIKIGKHVYGIIEFFSHYIRATDTALMQVVGEIGLKIGQFIERKDSETALHAEETARLTAERANEAKSVFLSRMSHELRTPLNAVLGFAQLLDIGELDPEQKQHVQRILKGGRHLLSLINQVLDIARIQTGRLTFSLEPVPVSTIIGEAVDLVRPQAAARSIRLVVPAAPQTAVHIRADQQRLKQVLLNLLSNGVKYNREGGTLTVSCEPIQDNRFRITVTDTGGGIPPALMSRLFTPFDRLDADTRIEGAGLGLVLSRSLVSAMDGTISVDSEVERGTSISIDFPLDHTPAAGAAAPSEKPQIPSPAGGGSFTILYIEDNLSNYKLIEHLSSKRPGIKLVGAMQGKLGVELAVAHRPDLILLDLNLPDIQGDEVLLRLRERPETAGIPVVMLSADAMPKQIDKLLAAGARQYLTKPIDVGKFFSMLNEFITQKGGS